MFIKAWPAATHSSRSQFKRINDNSRNISSTSDCPHTASFYHSGHLEPSTGSTEQDNNIFAVTKCFPFVSDVVSHHIFQLNRGRGPGFDSSRTFEDVSVALTNINTDDSMGLDSFNDIFLHFSSRFVFATRFWDMQCNMCKPGNPLGSRRLSDWANAQGIYQEGSKAKNIEIWIQG